MADAPNETVANNQAASDFNMREDRVGRAVFGDDLEEAREASMQMMDNEFEIDIANRLGPFRGKSGNIDADHAEMIRVMGVHDRDNPTHKAWNLDGLYTHPYEKSSENEERLNDHYGKVMDRANETNRARGVPEQKFEPDTVYAVGPDNIGGDSNPYNQQSNVWPHEFGHRAFPDNSHSFIYMMDAYTARTKSEWDEAIMRTVKHQGGRKEHRGKKIKTLFSEVEQEYVRDMENPESYIRRRERKLIEDPEVNWASREGEKPFVSDTVEEQDRLNNSRYWTQVQFDRDNAADPETDRHSGNVNEE
jgi:hypothetical protein